MKNHRQKIYIDREVQGGIALRLTVYWVCTLIVAFAMLIVGQCMLDPLTPFMTQLAHARALVLPIAATFLVLLPMVLWDLTKITHRFVGPVARLKRGMRELRDGSHRGELKFREKDYWQELADEFNLLAWQVEAWKKQATRMQAEAELVAAGEKD